MQRQEDKFSGDVRCSRDVLPIMTKENGLMKQISSGTLTVEGLLTIIVAEVV